MSLRLKFLLLATALLTLGCQARSEESSAVIYQSVAVVKVVQQSEFLLDRSFTGVVLPARRADFAFEFGGTVEFMLVDEGDPVEEGDLLAQLDTSLLVIERRQLDAQLREAQANLRLTKSNLVRHQSLESDGFASQQRRDELEAGRDAIGAKISQLEAMLDGNDIRQKKAHIYAPFAGVVSERYLEQGSRAGVGEPVLRLLDTTLMEAHVGVPRQLARSLSPGQMVKVEVDGELVQGSVLALGAELKAQSHTVTVRIELPPMEVLSGSLVRLQFEDKIEGIGFTLPQSALTANLRGLWRVYVLKPAGEDLYRVEARDVQLRFLDEHRGYVEGGLSDGDLVVSQGIQKLVRGQLVRISSGAAPT